MPYAPSLPPAPARPSPTAENGSEFAPHRDLVTWETWETWEAWETWETWETWGTWAHRIVGAWARRVAACLPGAAVRVHGVAACTGPRVAACVRGHADAAAARAACARASSGCRRAPLRAHGGRSHRGLQRLGFRVRVRVRVRVHRTEPTASSQARARRAVWAGTRGAGTASTWRGRTRAWATPSTWPPSTLCSCPYAARCHPHPTTYPTPTPIPSPAETPDPTPYPNPAATCPYAAHPLPLYLPCISPASRLYLPHISVLSRSRAGLVWLRRGGGGPTRWDDPNPNPKPQP